MLIAGLAYQGRADERYSLANHFISELGEIAHSELAWAFNIGLIIGGLLLTVSLLGLAVYIRGWFSYPFGLVGLVTGLSGTLVGFFPMDNLIPHFRVAMTFFNFGMATTVMFSIYVVFFRQDKFAKWLAIPGGITAICFFALLFLTDPILPDNAGLETLSEILTNRPPVLETAIIEWAVGISVFAWIVAVALFLRTKEKNQVHGDKE
jgi:hypothetical membrane protein